ncbi:hypothetical protein KAR91_13835, partial [Candidatus Pacearchaeota archaeon]|nr:hypothetical protein [Candidatus Pacearchaeota archaeon]
MNFKEDLKKILIDELAQFDENIDDSCNIKELVRKHFNLLAKTIRPYPRKIHKSTEFVNKEKTLDDQFKTALYEICKKLEVGENVNAHLSKDAIKPSYNDLLQNDWG